MQILSERKWNIQGKPGSPMIFTTGSLLTDGREKYLHARGQVFKNEMGVSRKNVRHPAGCDLFRKKLKKSIRKMNILFRK